MMDPRKHRFHRFHGTVCLATIIIIYSTFQSASWIERNSSSNDTKITRESMSLSVSSSSSSSFLLPKNNSTMFRPLTKIDRDDQCNDNNIPHHQPVEKRDTFSTYQDPSKFFNTTTLGDSTGRWSLQNNNSTMILEPCRLHSDKTSSSHFPHVMQQLYACYTYWQNSHRQGEEINHQSERLPILVLSSSSALSTLPILRQNPFLQGVLQTLENQMNVQIVSERELRTKIQVNLNLQIQDFGRDVLSGGYILSNVTQLNQMVHQEFHLEEVDEKHGQRLHAACTPTIGLLNRRPSSGRSILNANKILQHLQEHFSSSSTSSLDTNLTMTADVLLEPEYFEQDRSFQQQVQFFSKVDILISPHGAQLTGIPFLGSRRLRHLFDTNNKDHHSSGNASCTLHKQQLLEIFPPKYFIPEFFGSLAVNSNIGYSHLYISDEPAELQSQMSTVFERQDARAQNLCIDSNVIVSTLTRMVDDWKRPCTCDY